METHVKKVRPEASSPHACILTQLMMSTQVFIAAGRGRVDGSRRKTMRMRASKPMCQFPTVPRPSVRGGSTSQRGCRSSEGACHLKLATGVSALRLVPVRRRPATFHDTALMKRHTLIGGVCHEDGPVFSRKVLKVQGRRVIVAVLFSREQVGREEVDRGSLIARGDNDAARRTKMSGTNV